VIVTNHGLGHGLTVISTFPMMKVLALVWCGSSECGFPRCDGL